MICCILFPFNWRRHCKGDNTDCQRCTKLKVENSNSVRSFLIMGKLHFSYMWLLYFYFLTIFLCTDIYEQKVSSIKKIFYVYENVNCPSTQMLTYNWWGRDEKVEEKEYKYRKTPTLKIKGSKHTQQQIIGIKLKWTVEH